MNPSCPNIRAFDDIGNRKSTKTGGDSGGAGLRSASYTANNLNQYSSRDISGTVDVLGIANAATTVTVNGQSASRKGEYFQSAPAYTNTSAALYPLITNTAILSGNTNTVTGQVFIAKTPETFTYDADGNQTSDGRWTNRWDGENRLITMESLASAPSGSSNRLTFTYDFMGRRVSKQVETWTNSAYSTIVSNKFVYDGWNLVAELNGTNNTAIRTYLWGMDLSGSMQGAGGVGGLLAVKDAVNATHFAAYDGNGNVTGLFSAADGTTSAVYEYDPFGNLLRATGLMAKVNPFRFSTKYQDDETDWSYYGYRFYNASMGRWLSRDPIEEQGGWSLYGFVCNKPTQFIDKWGAVPIGSYTVTSVDVNIDGDKAYKWELPSGTTSVKGFEVRYRISKADIKVCPCTVKDIVLVQAVKNDGPANRNPHIDADQVDVDLNKATKGGIPPPPYLANNAKKARVPGPLAYQDSPYAPDAVNTIFTFEVCAICRVTGKPDVILGCLSFTFKDKDKTVSKEGPYPAEAPGELWNVAIQTWVNQGGKK